MMYPLNTTTLSMGVINKYLNPVFVETGSFHGGGIQLALNVGFREVHSIELHKPFHDEVATMFRGENNVHLYSGDSIDLLGQVIEHIDAPITFWLDGHFEPGGSVGKKRVPLIEELEAIVGHHRKDHTIMVDDVVAAGREFDGWMGDSWKEVTIDRIQQALYKINKKYKIIYEDHPPGGSKRAIMVATL